MNIVKENAPHIRKKISVQRMMLDVIIALLPVVIMSLVIYQLKALMIIGISIVTMVLAEFVYVGLRNKMPKDGDKHSFKEKFLFAYKGHYTSVNIIAPIVSALIFAMIMPANATWYATLIGSLLGITLGKLVFGGLGNNIFNPAAVGMVIAKICFSSSYPAMDYSKYSFIDVSAGGTPLSDLASNGLSQALNDYSILNLLFGRIGGTLGEACSILIIIGAIYLIIRHAADFRSMLSYLGTFLFLILISGIVIINVNSNNINYLSFVLYELLTGGLLFGAAFMITDPVTSPITSPGRVIYGILAGILTIFIRFFAALPEGVAFSILIANMCAPLIDQVKWSSQKYTVKKLIVMACMLVISAAILVIVLIFKKDGFWYE